MPRHPHHRVQKAVPKLKKLGLLFLEESAELFVSHFIVRAGGQNLSGLFRWRMPIRRRLFFFLYFRFGHKLNAPSYSHALPLPERGRANIYWQSPSGSRGKISGKIGPLLAAAPGMLLSDFTRLLFDAESGPDV